MAPAAPFLVLGFHPSSRGFGWIVLEGPAVAFDWGTADIRSNKNDRALNRLRSLIKRYEPDVLVLEAFDDPTSQRRERIRLLSRSAIVLAAEFGVQASVCSRAEIHAAFIGEGSCTRDAVAMAVAARLPVLRSRLPRERKIWVGEHPNMALFCAAACALTCYAIHAPLP